MSDCLTMNCTVFGVDFNYHSNVGEYFNDITVMGYVGTARQKVVCCLMNAITGTEPEIRQKIIDLEIEGYERCLKKLVYRFFSDEVITRVESDPIGHVGSPDSVISEYARSLL